MEWTIGSKSEIVRFPPSEVLEAELVDKSSTAVSLANDTLAVILTY